eukprot:1011791-Pyramimonas_sp.AAC.1
MIHMVHKYMPLAFVSGDALMRTRGQEQRAANAQTLSNTPGPKNVPALVCASLEERVQRLLLAGTAGPARFCAHAH